MLQVDFRQFAPELHNIMSYRTFSFFALLFSVFLTAMEPVAAADPKQIALIVGGEDGGNSGANNVKNIKDSLVKLGFDPEILPHGWTSKDLQTATTIFTQKLKSAGKGSVGFFYYSGHGAAQSPIGPNYLIPVKASYGSLQGGTRDSLWEKSVELGALVEKVKRDAEGSRVFFIIDACNSPLRKYNGLRAPYSLVTEPVRKNTLISFSTAPKYTQTLNACKPSSPGLYAKILSEELGGVEKKGELAELIKRTRIKVAVESDFQQTPWIEDGLETTVLVKKVGMIRSLFKSFWKR